MAPAKAPAVKLKYTNRKSDALKLATIVAKDLRKHSTSFDKKNSTTENDSAPLELNLEHKDQIDACVETFVPELENVLKAREGVMPLRLEEMSLRNNKLTAASLRLLAPVIEAARFDLRDVDVSKNWICVTTREEAQAFATFLRAFSGCNLMRRLDLSDNDFSGPLAMEVLLRVYCEQQPVEPSLLYYDNGRGRRDVEYEMLSKRTSGSNTSPKSRTHDTFDDMDASNQSLARGRLLQRRQGLRAIPYIILKDTRLDDAGALHLSYVLEQHHWPQYLMTKLKDGSREAKRKEEDDAGGCFGLVFSGNPLLSSYGAKVLEYANAARTELSGAQVLLQTPQSSWIDAVKVATPSVRSRKMSFQSDGSDRCASGASANMLSLRKRLQRTTIELHGVHGVQLWHAAVKVLYAARVILPSAKKIQSTGDDAIYASQVEVTNAAHGEPVLAVTKETKKPTPPTISDFSRQPTSTPVGYVSLLQPKTNDMNGTPKLRAPIVLDKQFNRDRNNPKDFPTGLWRRIIVEYAEGTDVLNEEQIGSIIEYARDRSNIVGEQQNQAKGESHQLWHVLEELDCFTYELKTAGN